VGKPFAPGPDPRRHLQGRKSRDIIAFAAELNRELAEQIDARELVRVLKERAIRGNLQAIEIVLDRVLGKAFIRAELSPGPSHYIITYADTPENFAAAYGLDAEKLRDWADLGPPEPIAPLGSRPTLPEPSPRVREAIAEGDKKRALAAAKVVPGLPDDEDIFEK
jgi:hypothetical protein